MFKLVVLSVLLAVAAAAPSGLSLAGPVALSAPLLSKTIVTSHPGSILNTAVIAEPSHVQISEPVVAKVGDIVQSVPTAVSHQSSTVVHNRANIVTPIVAPAVKTITAPVLRTVGTPLISAPLINTIHTPLTLTAAGLPLTYAAHAPVVKTISSHLAYSAPLGHAW